MHNRKKYTLQNPLMFAIVMKDADRCIGLLERIFPGRKVKELNFVYAADEDEAQRDWNIKTEEFRPEPERTYIVGIEAKSIRMDVLFENSDAWYDIEMQVYNTGNLPKRSRYYHAVKTVDALKPGDDYNKLKPGYVIFINAFDLFGLGEPVYSFEMFDKKLQLPLGDEQYTIFLNSTCKDNVPPELEGFYRYMQTGEVTAGDEWLTDMAAAVEDANEREEVWRKVTLYDEIKMMENMLQEKEQKIADKDQALAAKNEELAAKNEELAGKDQALVAKDQELEAKDQELARINHLTIALAQQGRMEDLVRAAEDAEYRDKLMTELNI